MLPTHESYLRTRTFASLDGLRAWAILAVVHFHVFGLIVPDWFVLGSRGYMGVHLFFVVSGFLITTLLLREREATGRISLGQFYVRRVLRIFPLYYAVLGLYCVLVRFADHNPIAAREFWHNLPYFATYTSNWFVPLLKDGQLNPHIHFYFSWSLATEEQFYLIWPFVLKFVPRAIGVPLLFAAIAINQFALLHVVDVGKAQPFLESISSAICLGVLLAITLHSKRGFGMLRDMLGRRWSMPAALFLVVACLCVRVGVSSIWEFVIDAAFTLFLGTCIIRPDHGLRGLVQCKPIAVIGVVSYGIYLLHMLCLRVAEMALSKVGLSGPYAKFFGGLAVVIVVAWISYRCFESHFLKLKKHFKPRERVEAPVVVAIPHEPIVRLDSAGTLEAETAAPK